MATNAQIREHIEQNAPIIQKFAKLYGYQVCSPIIAQSITETVSSKDKSGWSILKYKYNNFFGMKAGKYWKGASVNLRTGEFYNGNYVNINDNFRVYPDVQSGIEGYFIFTSSARYSKLKIAKTPLQYLQELQKAGYATSPNYITTNMGHINKWNLTKYDNIADTVNLYPEVQSLPVLKVGMNDRELGAKYIESWQIYLNTCGYNIAINGIFSSEMLSAVMKYQRSKNLVSDGIIGAKTWASVPKI